MVESADVTRAMPRQALAPAVPATAMWLPESALNCYVGNPLLRAWLCTPGLLTQRIREAAGDRFCMHLLCEARFGDEQVREIDMGLLERPWLFAHTRIPAATLLAAPWLATIGNRTLGEALAEHDELQRAPFRFALLGADATVVARALTHAQLATQTLWVRHSAFTLNGDRFDLYEVFLPGIGESSRTTVGATS